MDFEGNYYYKNKLTQINFKSAKILLRSLSKSNDKENQYSNKSSFLKAAVEDINVYSK